MNVAGIVVAFLIVGGASSAPTISPDDIRDFTAIVPVEKIWAIVSDYLAYDNDVKNIVGYIHTAEFKHMITEIDALPEFTEFLDSLEKSGYPAYKYWNIVHTVLGMATIVNPNETQPPQLTGGVGGLVTDIRSLINEDEIKKFYELKLKANPEFKSLVDHFQGEKFKKLFGELSALPEVRTMIEKMGLSELVHHHKKDD